MKSVEALQRAVCTLRGRPQSSSRASGLSGLLQGTFPAPAGQPYGAALTVAGVLLGGWFIKWVQERLAAYEDITFGSLQGSSGGCWGGAGWGATQLWRTGRRRCLPACLLMRW